MTDMPIPESPETYPRRILLAVTGLSPQIVTETLYALAVKRDPAWVPTEIQVVTTARGAKEVALNLFSEERDWFARLCRDYELPPIKFAAGDIHVMRRRGGEVLEDIRDEADNMAAADYITEHVRALTADVQASLHASIAGGRKTMGFFLGYALSLFGRAQDRLSHVLVSAPFESHKDFYYPSRNTRVLDAKPHTLDANDAKVWLGDIPFVRLREGLPNDLLMGNARFSEAVVEAQKALPPLSLILDPATFTITAGGEVFKLNLPEFVFYWMLAERCRQHKPGAHWSEKEIGAELLAYYRRVLNPNSGEFERAEKTCKRFSKENFDPRKSHINDALQRALGERRSKPYLITGLGPIAGSRYRRSGLALPPQSISVAASKPVKKSPSSNATSLRHGQRTGRRR